MVNKLKKSRLEAIGALFPKKYVSYALGEIVLIVLGILIALQIDNWNSDRQTKAVEIKYLKEMIPNLEADLSDVESNIAFNSNKRNSNRILATHLKNKLPYTDSLGFHFSNLIGTTHFVPNTSAYENLKAKGFDIIQNDSLRRSITQLYSGEYTHIIGFEFQDDHRFQYEIFFPQVIENANVTEVWKLGAPIHYERLLSNVQFQNALVHNIFYRTYMIDEYKKQKTLIRDLISSIRKYLKEEGEE